MNRKYQKGATMWGWLSVVGMIGFIAMLAFKVVPIYFEHRIVRSALQDVVDSREFSNMSNKSIVRTIQSRLTINNVRTIKYDSFKAARDRTGEKYILVSYEQKVPIMSNLFAVVEFNEEIRPNR
ncbi:MAG: DUF4845 domain-containing protein [Kangiellaceae bacterium]|nr:DUF4845 domain-containing protein [Kangiellaceae bacterium]